MNEKSFDEQFKQYPKIRPVGYDDNKELLADPEDSIVIEEKIDGGNFRFYIHEGKIVFGSRTQVLGSEQLESKHLKAFKRAIKHVQEALQGKDMKLLEHRIYYGECCIKHTMHYDWDNIPPFLGFDVYCLANEKFLAKKEMLFAAMGLETVPLIKTCKAGEIKELSDEDVPITAYPPSAKPDLRAEGIVLKNYNKQLFAKYVRDEFKEENAAVFGGSPKLNKVDETDNAEVVFKYCTNARIDKVIFKLIDEGHTLEMKLMEHLPKRVYADIMEEEGNTILTSRWNVDFGKLRKLITKRCAAVLNQVITNNAFEAENMEPLNNTCVEVLPALLRFFDTDGKEGKSQTIRQAWKEIKCETVADFKHESAELQSDGYVLKETFVMGSSRGAIGPTQAVFEKPAAYKVGDVVPVVWHEEAPDDEIFCAYCGNPLIFMTMKDGRYCNCTGKNIVTTNTAISAGINLFPHAFRKVLGTVRITEVFKIEIGRLPDWHYVSIDGKIKSGLHFTGKFCDEIIDLAKRDGFTKPESMFRYFEDNHDLSTPKPFWVYRYK